VWAASGTTVPGGEDGVAHGDFGSWNHGLAEEIGHDDSVGAGYAARLLHISDDHKFASLSLVRPCTSKVSSSTSTP